MSAAGLAAGTSLHITALTLSGAIVAGVLMAGDLARLVALLLVVLTLALAIAMVWRRGADGYRVVIKPIPIAVPLLLLLASVGVLRGHYWLQDALHHRLPLSQDRQQVTLTLSVIEVERAAHGIRFVANVINAEPALPLRRVRLSWYAGEAGSMHLGRGDLVTLTAVLRAPRRFANYLSFDYEAFILGRGIDALGYVKMLQSRQSDTANAAGGLTSLRQGLLDEVQNRHSAIASSWISGLVLGDRGAFSADQWRLAQYTGTLHLLVVSGLHMAMVAFAALLLAGLSWRLLLLSHMAQVLQYYQRHWYAGWVVMVCLGYAWLSGGGIAVQRAFLILLLGWCLWFSVRRFSAIGLLLAVMALLLWLNPMRFTQIGFQYSFLAVAALVVAFRGRRTARLGGWLLPQWLIFVALMPLFLMWQAPVNAGHLIANMVAIPLVTLLLLPLAFLTLLLPQWLPDVLLERVSLWFWQTLEWLAEFGWTDVLTPPEPLWVCAWFVLLWLSLRGLSFPVNQLLWLMPLLLLLSPGRGEAVVEMLDVGQGLAIIATDGQQALVYDAGPRYSQAFDAGHAMVLPRLRSLAVQPATVVISHSDLDHAGGEAALRNALAGNKNVRWFSGQPDKIAGVDCRSDDRWRVLGAQLRFRFLRYEAESDSDNNHSCVLQLHWYGQRLLLPGDIEADVEKQLVARYGQQLASDVLVAPHHGSASSSSTAFLAAVQPQQVWVSAGFNNRFRHPAQKVVHRYQRLGIEIKNTAIHGALQLKPMAELEFARQGWQRPWLYP